MGFSFDFVPFTKREMPGDPRVYNYFPEAFRSRFIKIFSNLMNDGVVREIYSEYHTEFPGELEFFEVFDDGSINKPRKSHIEFIKKGDDELIIDYMEYVINYCWENASSQYMIKCDSQIRRALREERVLFRIKPDRDYILNAQKSTSGPYSPSKHKPIHFELLGSEPLVEADANLRIFEHDSKWDKAVNHYTTAWEYYQEEQFNSTIPEELAKAVEEVCEVICKQEQDWVDSGAGPGRCLDEIKNQGLFEPNNELYPESEKIFVGLKLSAQKAGGDKHRHEEVNQDYCILLLHQTAAFMTYLIKRYEKSFG